MVLGFLAVSVAVIGTASYWGFVHHPDYTSPRGAAAQARIVEVFGAPENDDPVLIGDYAIERFYAIEPTSGRVYVADLCKGRVRHVLESTLPDGTISYTLDLDRSAITSKDLLQLISNMEVPGDNSTYLGVRVPAGRREAVALNYDGRLPQEHTDFRSRQGDDIKAFLERIAAGEWRPAIHLMNNNGTNYLFTSTDMYPYFTAVFGIKNVLLLSSLEFVDGKVVTVAGGM